MFLIGLGCAPIYPCIIHSTPAHFGEERSQALIGVQMASAYVGTCLMPPLFGLIAEHITVALMPAYLLAILVLMVFMHEQLLKSDWFSFPRFEKFPKKVLQKFRKFFILWIETCPPAVRLNPCGLNTRGDKS